MTISSYAKGGAAIGALLATATVPAAAEQKLTLERVFANPDLSGPQPRALKLSPDGKLVTLLKPRTDDKERLDLWAIDSSTGAERMLVDSKKVGSGAELSEAEKMQRERDRSIAGIRASSATTGRPMARASWSLSMAISFWPRWMVASHV
jgi:dipeptidyl-peptidase-4